MDLKDFKKVGITNTHTIFEHPEGHVIHVSHSGIPQKLKNQMRDIPVQKLAEGTPDGPLESPEDNSQDPMQRIMAMESQPPSAPLTPVETSELNLQPVVENKNFIPQQQPQQQEEVAPPMSPEIGQQAAVLGGQQQIRAEKGLGEAEAAKASAEQQQLQQNIVDLQNFEAARQKRHEENRKRVEQSVKDMMEHPEIDPHRYWGNLDTGQKIMSSIGLILGGIGAGMTHTENMAMKYLMSTIDKDIEAQKQNLDKKNTIYKANLQMLKDEDEAEDMTRAQMLEMAKLKMGQAALSQGTQIARLNHERRVGELMAAQEGPLSRLAQAQTMNQYAGKTVSSPAVVNTMISALPKEQQKEATKYYNDYKESEQALTTIVPQMKRIANLGMSGKLFSIEERQNIKQINQQLIKVAAQLVASPDLRARMSKDSVNTLINPYRIDVTSFGAADLQKVQNLENALREAQSNAADALGGYKIKLQKPILQAPLQTRK